MFVYFKVQYSCIILVVKVKITIARTNTLALNSTLHRMTLCDSPVCEACPYNAPNHFNTSLQKYKRSKFARMC